jgi:hypothetical protein
MTAPVTARLAAKDPSVVGVLGMWWKGGKWELAGTMPLLHEACIGSSRLFTPNRDGTPAPFPAGTPLVFEYLNRKGKLAFDSIQTGTPNPIRLYASREIEGPRLSVIESARAAVVSYPDSTAQIGFVARIGDPTPRRFADYPIRVEVTNVSPLF